MCRDLPPDGILDALRDENMYDPRQRIEIVSDKSYYMPQLLSVANAKTQPSDQKDQSGKANNLAGNANKTDLMPSSPTTVVV